MIDLAVAAERCARQLDARGNPTLAGLPEILLRGLKAAEESGELAQAVIGVTGQNPRKGHSHTWDDVLAEAVDVCVTALVFVASVRPGVVVDIVAHWDRRVMLSGGRDLVAAVERTTVVLDRRATLADLPELVLRVMRVQAAGGRLAEAVTEAAAAASIVGSADPAAWDWTGPVAAALELAVAALVVVESVRPGQLVPLVGERVGFLAERAARSAVPAVAP